MAGVFDQSASDIAHSRVSAKFPISSGVVAGLTVLIDSAAILLSGIVLWLALVNLGASAIPPYAAAISFIWIVVLLLFHFTGLYEFEPITKPLSFLDKLIIAFLTAFMFLLAAAFAIKISATYSRIWVVSFAVTSGGALLAGRVLFSVIVAHLSDRRILTRNIVVAGSGEQSKRLLANIRETDPCFMSVLGVFATGPSFPDGRHCGFPILGTLNDITTYARTNRVDDVIIALPWAAEDETLALVDKLRELPVNVYLASDLVGFKLDCRPPPSHFGSLPITEVVGRPMSDWRTLLKALEDYALATLAIVALSPVLALVALAVRLDSPGPVLFKQKRHGFNNQVFEIYKFRTMRHEPYAEGGTVQARVHDPRVTKVGRILRRTSLDELPQLFNVLNGTMSLVGPRPHAVDHNLQYSQQIRWYFARHRVKPGITGWAQVSGLRGETDVPEKMAARVKRDIYYVENWSLWFDVQILARTLFIVLIGRNAY
jgi:Undecaprenyl-phosphate glucose phosphotransferase